MKHAALRFIGFVKLTELLLSLNSVYSDWIPSRNISNQSFILCLITFLLIVYLKYEFTCQNTNTVNFVDFVAGGMIGVFFLDMNLII